MCIHIWLSGCATVPATLMPGVCSTNTIDGNQRFDDPEMQFPEFSAKFDTHLTVLPPQKIPCIGLPLQIHRLSNIITTDYFFHTHFHKPNLWFEPVLVSRWSIISELICPQLLTGHLPHLSEKSYKVFLCLSHSHLIVPAWTFQIPVISGSM